MLEFSCTCKKNWKFVGNLFLHHPLIFLQEDLRNIARATKLVKIQNIISVTFESEGHTL